MIILDSTTTKVQIVLQGNVQANQAQCMATWRDITSTTYVAGKTMCNTSNTTDVDLVPAPLSSTQRVIDFISVYNKDTTNVVVTIKVDIDGTEYVLTNVNLATRERLEYNDKDGFITKDDAGRIKTAVYNNNGIAAMSALNVLVMTGDVTNNNATLNTIADVTGLSFAVTAGETYWFEFVIPYTSAATSTGSRWSINGPANPTLLAYRSEYTLTATTTTVNSANAYDIPAASNASSLAAGNVATIWGIIKPSQNGTVIARFASEIANSAIVAKAGAVVRWMRII